MATTYLSPLGNDSNFTVTGLPASGYKLFTYQAGTTTKQVTYQGNTDASTQNANPILLSSQGYPASGGAVVEIWLTGAQAYKFVLAPSTDTDPPSNPVWTRDNIEGLNDPGFNPSVTQSEWVSGTAPTFVSSTSFTVTGDQRSTYHVNRRVKTTNTGGTVYSTIVSSAFSTVTTVTVVNDSGTIDSGLSAVSYGLISSTNTSEPTPLPSSPFICEGRLTLASGTAVTTTDQTAKTSVFFTPFRGSRISLYSGTAWVVFSFSEQTLTVPATTATMYDVFMVYSTLALEALAWTNDTTRATALTTQNGVLVKTGDATRRYLGSFRTTGVSGQTEDSKLKRYLWNYYNRVLRFLSVVDTTNTWTYTTATYQQANASTANQVEIVVGVQEALLRARVDSSGSNSAVGGPATFSVGIGIDSSTVNSAQTMTMGTAFTASTPSGSITAQVSAQYIAYPAVGKHDIRWLEISSAAGTTTWYGNNGLTYVQSGLTADLL